jgi:RHS repeat-associated protein
VATLDTAARPGTALGGTQLRRIRYSTYGVPHAPAAGDIDGDGSTATSDLTALLAAWGSSYGDMAYHAAADVDLDGSIGTSDLLIVQANFSTQPERGVLQRTGAAGVWGGASLRVGFGGSLYDAAAGLYLMRNRWYDPRLGRFITRDPAGYVDGISLYQYVRGNPLVYFDPFGLFADTYVGKFLNRAGELASDIKETATDMVAEVVMSSAHTTGLISTETYMRNSPVLVDANAGFDRYAAEAEDADVSVGARLVGDAANQFIDTSVAAATGDPEAAAELVVGGASAAIPGALPLRATRAVDALIPDAPAVTQKLNSAGSGGSLDDLADAASSMDTIPEGQRIVHLPEYPGNDGLSHGPFDTTLEPGTRVDRYGPPEGSYVSPAGTPLEQRSLLPGRESQKLYTYEVQKPVPAKSGVIAPYYGWPGGGIQHHTPMSVQHYVDTGCMIEIR